MRFVVKVGTSTIAYPNGRLNIRHIEKLCKVISDLMNEGHEIVLVSSGAIGMGVGKLNLDKRPDDTTTKRAAAAIGQCELMYTYDKLFSEYRHNTAQILLMGSDIAQEDRKLNFQNTLNRLLELRALPIINENDTLAMEENVIGDNDTLSAIVAVSANADLLILLSDIDGLYTKDPHVCDDGEIIHEVKAITEDIIALAGGKGSSLGTGGMATKICAAQMAMENGIDMVIANGADPNVLYKVVEGQKIGTRFIGKSE